MFISGAQCRHLVSNQDAQLVDVRSEAEFMQGAAPGAINIPVHAIPHASKHLDPAKPVVVYCASGGRSAQAQMILRAMGYQDVHNLGGLNNFFNS
ncbi:MAG: rhodanese-like domain-containing protein [Gammaproteobacteria bacterium]|nr:rhodanese-like domain-containing protein [Gammaproteobacteria bacterium]